jgi:transglutaminase/protease-like cytokinesis protein 3
MLLDLLLGILQGMDNANNTYGGNTYNNYNGNNYNGNTPNIYGGHSGNVPSSWGNNRNVNSYGNQNSYGGNYNGNVNNYSGYNGSIPSNYGNSYNGNQNNYNNNYGYGGSVGNQNNYGGQNGSNYIDNNFGGNGIMNLIGAGQSFQGDLSLKNIASVQQLVQLKNSGQLSYASVPGFISQNEMNINSSPYSKIDFYKTYLSMISQDKDNISLNYYNVTQNQLSDLMTMARESFAEFCNIYPELTSYFSSIKTQISYSGNRGVLKITLDWEYINKKCSFDDIQNTIYACAYVISELKRAGKITDSMSQYDKAKVLYQWVIFHTQYAQNNSRENYTPNGLLFSGRAVCQGYVGVFNLLCKMVGINITGVTGSTNHSVNGSTQIWSFAILDGKQVYIDVTWGDPVVTNGTNLQMRGFDMSNICDLTYFDISKQNLMQTHYWTPYYEDLIINNKLKS